MEDGGSEAQNDRHSDISSPFRYRGSPLFLLSSRSEIVIVMALELVLGFFCRVALAPDGKGLAKAVDVDKGEPAVDATI